MRRRPDPKRADAPARPVYYGRVSTQSQVDGGTIETQLEAFREHRDRHHPHAPDPITDDGVSGVLPIAERPGGARLLRAVRDGHANRVIVWKFDRLGRSPGDTIGTVEQFTRLGVSVESLTERVVTGTPQADFILGMYASVAGLERANILERTGLGKLRAARAGYWTGGAPPYGYRLARDGERTRLEPFEPEARWVPHVFERYAGGLTGWRIAEELDALGAPTRTGAPWSQGQVSKILTHPVYRGRVQLGWTNGRRDLASGPAPALVSADLAARADAVERRGGRNRTREYPLTGLLRCPACGSRVTGGLNGRHPHYGCSSKANPRVACPHKTRSVHADALEAAAWASLVAFLTDPRALEAWARRALGDDPGARPAGPDPAALRADLAAERERVNYQFQKGYLAVDAYERAMAEFERRERDVARLEAERAPRVAASAGAVRSAVDAARAGARGLGRVPAAERGELVREFLLAGEVAPPEPPEGLRYFRHTHPAYAAAVAAGARFEWTLEHLVEG